MDSIKKQHTKKIILTTFAVGAAGVLGYFGWQFYQKKRAQRLTTGSSASSDLDNLLKTSSNAAPTDPVPITVPAATLPPLQTTRVRPVVTAAAPRLMASNGFPLKKGSKGEKVRRLQQALLDKYGASILPKYGADGGFGAETAAALRTAHLPAVIDESTFNVLTQAGGSNTTGSTDLGTQLVQATASGDFAAALAGLRQMNSTADYTAANAVYKTRRISGVRKTIVTGLLDTFSTPDQQQQIKYEFLRIGLQFNGDKWSLSGLGGLPLITVRRAAIWTSARNRVQVPPRVVLGNEVSRKLDYTLFENQGQYFLVPTRCVRYV